MINRRAFGAQLQDVISPEQKGLQNAVLQNACDFFSTQDNGKPCMQMGDPSRDWTSNNLDHNYSQKCLPPHSANVTYPEQTTNGNYFQQYSCRILQPTSYKIVTCSTPLSNDLKPTQENHLNSKCTLPTGKQENNIVLWTPPGSRVQVFVPVIMQETNHVPNISNCVSRPNTEVFNFNKGVCMQQKSTSVPADPNSLQQFPTKTIENKNLNDMQRDLTHANATNNLPQQDPSTKRMTLPSDHRYNPTTTNAPNGQNSSLGGPVYHGVRAEYSAEQAHLQTPSTCKQNVQQNNATKKAVAVVTPLSPVEMASVNFSNKSAHALDARSVPIHHLPNFTHPLKINADPRTMREPNEPVSKQQRPKSAEPRLGSDVVKSPVCLLESTSQRDHASSPKLNCPVTDQNKPAEIQKEASENMAKDKQAVTEKTNTGETDKYSTIPVIEWPLDKLHTLIYIIQQIEDVHQKNVKKMESGKEILRLYWNGDVCKFRNAVKSEIYQNVMEEVYNYCQGTDSVILRQIKNNTWNQVAKEFHVLKHAEVPPKIEYKSSWLNLDENLDDIDRECGISWYFRHLHSSSQEQEKGNSAGQLHHRMLVSPDKPSKRQCSTGTNCQNLVPEDEQTFPRSKDKTMDNEGLYEHLSVTSNEQFLHSQNTAAQTNMPNNSLISIENVSMAETSSVISAGGHCLEEDLQKVNAPQEITLSNSNPPQELETIPRDEQISVKRFEEKTNNSVHTIQNPLPEASHKSPITGHGRFAMEIVSKTPAEVQTSSVYENSPDSVIKQSCADANRHVPTLDDVVTEETSCQPNAINPLMGITNLVKTFDNQAVAKSRSSAGTSGRGRLYGGRAVQSNDSNRTSNCAGSPNVKANESQVKKSAHAAQSAFREGTGHRDAKAVKKVRVEKQMQLEFENKNSDCQSGGLLTETGDREDNCLLKPESVVTGQTNCQPNTVNSLKGLANVFRTLEKSDISLRIYENQIGKQEVLKRSGSGVTSPILTDLLMNRSALKLSPTAAEQQAQIQNGSDERTTNGDCVDKMIDEPSITKRDYFAMEIGNKVPAEPQISPENVKLSKNLPGFVREQSLTETNSNYSIKCKRVDTEQSSHQPHIVNSLAAMTKKVCSIDKLVALQKPGMSKTKNQHAGKMSRWDVRSVLTKPNIQSGRTNSKLNPVVEEQQKAVQLPRRQNECNEKTDEINVRPHKVAKLCFSSEMTEGEDLQRDTAGASEIMHSSSRVNSEQCDNADKQCDSSSSSRSFLATPELLQEEEFMGSFEDEPKNSTHAAQNASLKLYKPSDEDILEGMHHSAVSETSGLDGGVCNGTDDESTIENNFTSPPKLDPMDFVPSPQMQDESSEMIPNNACALAEEYVTDVALSVNTEELEVDAFASIKINVLPHGIAEQWFAGKMTEDKDLQKDIVVHTFSKDQVDVEVLDHIDDQVDVNILEYSDDQVEIEILDHSDEQIRVLFPEKHAEDIKPIEKKNLGEVYEKLESYCCIAKWFQALNYGDGSFCKCQVKTELSEPKLEIKASDTRVKMHTNKDRFHVISKDHGCMDLKFDLLTNDGNSSESTKALLSLHTGTPNDAAVENIKTVKACPVSEVVSETSEQIKDESPFKCAMDKIPTRSSEKANPSSDVKKSSETVCLSLYGSSNRRDGLIRNKRYKNCGEKPPENLEITISSHQKNERRISMKRKWDKSMETDDALNVRKKDVRVSPKSSPRVHNATPMKVSEVINENALSSSTLTRKLFNPPLNSKSLSKKKQSLGTRQISMNNYVIRRKTMSPKSLHLPEPVLKSKYELRNPALMPLQEGFGLEFKVLPSSFNFKDGTELAHIQADALSRAKNGIPYTEDEKARRKTNRAPAQGTWSLSPLKSKQIQSADVSSSCSLFQEFKKRYQDKKETVSRQNLNSN